MAYIKHHHIYMQGTIKTKTDRGFGFITYEGAEKDLFFHTTACPEGLFDQLKEGNTVSFEIVQGDKGPAASNVQLV